MFKERGLLVVRLKIAPTVFKVFRYLTGLKAIQTLNEADRRFT